jgi:hypothetical protein
VDRPRSCRVIYYFDTPALGRRHQSFGRVSKQPRDDNDLQEVDLIEELVYDQFETTLSKTDFNESEDLHMIYSQEEIKVKKGTDNVVADHLSKLTIDSTSDIPPIDDYFPDESLLSLSPMP